MARAKKQTKQYIFQTFGGLVLKAFNASITCIDRNNKLHVLALKVKQAGNFDQKEW